MTRLTVSVEPPAAHQPLELSFDIDVGGQIRHFPAAGTQHISRKGQVVALPSTVGTFTLPDFVDDPGASRVALRVATTLRRQRRASRGAGGEPEINDDVLLVVRRYGYAEMFGQGEHTERSVEVGDEGRGFFEVTYRIDVQQIG